MVNSANYGTMWEPNFMSQVRPDVFSSTDYSSTYLPNRDVESYYPCSQPPPPPVTRPPHSMHNSHSHSHHSHNHNHTHSHSHSHSHSHTNNISNNSGSHCSNVGNSQANDDELANKFEQWKIIPVKQWTELDTMYWIMSTAESICVPFQDVALEKFGGMNGNSLLKLKESDFIAYDHTYGSLLFSRLAELRPECDTSINYQEYEDSDEGSAEVESAPSIKRKPGRPRTSNKHKKKRDQKLGRLWEFIRDLLFNEKYCPSFICWDNYEEGKFRFVQSNQVAQLWGTIKGNTKMNYEKFSRAMRYYYKSEIFLPVEGRRLVYQFGPKATGWKTDNPNFQKSKLNPNKKP